MIIGIDIGGTNFRIGAISDDLEVINFKKLSVHVVFDEKKPLESLYKFLKDYLDELAKDVEAIAIGFPATINKERTKVLQAPNLSYIENLDVVSYLEERLKIKVFLEKDTTMLLYYDINKYHVDTSGIVSSIYFGTGVGSMLLIDNKLVIGRNGTAGEIGHLYIEGNELRCGCGNIGCNESLVGGHYLNKLIETKYINTNITDIFVFHKDDNELKLFVERMAVLISNIENILDPDYILIGGGVISMNDFPKDYLITKVKEHTRKPLPADNLNIIFTQDDKDKGVIGAALYAKTKLNN